MPIVGTTIRLRRLTLIPVYYIEHQYIATTEKDTFYVENSRPYHDIPYQISLFSAMITYIKTVSFPFRIIRPISISFFHKIWLSILFSMGEQAMFSQFEETSRLTVVTSGESTYIASRLRVIFSGIRVKK